MGFFWICPCGNKNFYRGGLTTEAVTTCSACSLKLRIWKHRIVAKPQDNHNKPQRKKLFNYNGSLESLVIMANYAINTIKNKKEVKEQDPNSTWYQHYLSWTKWRKTFQIALEEKG